MSESLEAIVGLGNPGPRYESTRHNAGFWFADALARRCKAPFRSDNRSQGELTRVVLAGREIWLLKPQTWMNDSGRSVASLVNYYRLAPEQLLVAYDDLDLPPGTARLKVGGGHGGHNGLRDITAALGTPEFLRMRLGIGHPGAKDLVTPWVLSRPSKEERAAMEAAIDRALDAMPLVAEGRLQDAMTQLHSRKEEGGRGEAES